MVSIDDIVALSFMGRQRACMSLCDAFVVDGAECDGGFSGLAAGRRPVDIPRQYLVAGLVDVFPSEGIYLNISIFAIARIEHMDQDFHLMITSEKPTMKATRNPVALRVRVQRSV
jgi:hypothetical protein